jgi:hypothetical protein
LATWKNLAQANPALAQSGAGQLFQYGVGLAFLATVRKDGGPRLHPVCPVLSDEHLYVLILPASPKRFDLERDGRYALQAFAQAKPDSDEFYLTGRARLIQDPAVLDQILADARHPANSDEILFELEIERAMHTRWEGFGTPDYHPVHSTWVAPNVLMKR